MEPVQTATLKPDSGYPYAAAFAGAVGDVVKREKREDACDLLSVNFPTVGAVIEYQPETMFVVTDGVPS